MPKSLACCVVAATFLLCGVAAADPIVAYLLESSIAGQSLKPGDPVDWTIKVTVSTGDNLGLALVTADLVQDAGNPAKLDIPPGDPNSIPAVMIGFNRPGGITNPGEGGAASGYIGVQRGDAGEMNLIQAGGAQNTFGQPGSIFGTDPDVDGGIGQSGPQVILSGSFNAPATQGAYTFRLANAKANVLTAINTPPDFSPVAAATVNLDNASFTFNVGDLTICPGDLNCDDQIDFADINPFVLALSNWQAWKQTYPDCPEKNADINGDGLYGGPNGFGDINPFVALLASGGGNPIPCP